ncbi:MAG: hypothetical protein GXX82_08495 [Syntrophorhabdus sp.]|nr:hypothetical protein [Syntrophorhabdus sp.]
MEKEKDGVKGFESRERSRRQQEKEARGRGGDPLRDSPIDKSDVSPDLSPGGTRRDPEAIAKARNARIDRSARKSAEKGKGRSRQEYDEKMKAMKKDMAELKSRVNKLEKTVSKQAEKLKSRERGQERENERGRDRQRTMDRGRDR